MRTRPQLADVAARAATSSPVASRILNGDPTLRVRRELRSRVLHAAVELGYRPSAVARGLRRGETGALALVVPTLTNPTFARMSRQAVLEARARDYAVLLVEDRDEAPDRTISQLVRSGRIDGLLIASARPRMPLLQELRRWPIPHVFLNRAVPGTQRSVTMDDGDASRVAVEHLARLGHRRIAHLAAPLELDPARRRVAATRAAAKRLGLPPPVVLAQTSLEDGDPLLLAERLLQEAPGITAVYACSPLLAAGVLAALRRRAIPVPACFSVLAYTDAEMAPLLDPPLSVIEMPLEELGALAVTALIEQLGGAEPRDRVVERAPHLLLRGSTATAPAA